MAKTILFLAANPVDTDKLRLGTEAKEIEREQNIKKVST